MVGISFQVFFYFFGVAVARRTVWKWEISVASLTKSEFLFVRYFAPGSTYSLL